MAPWLPMMAMRGPRFSPTLAPRGEAQTRAPQRARREAASLEMLPSGGNGKAGLLIFFHGLGMSGMEFGEELEKRVAPRLPWLQLHYPNAPMRTVTYMFGERVRAWFDLDELPVGMGQEYSGLQEATACVHDLLRQAERNGIPASRIVLAGFSQGGALALQAGLTYEHAVAGIGAFSSWVPGNLQAVAKHKGTPIFFGHGEEDTAVPLTVGLASYKVLKDNGFAHASFARFRGLKHIFQPEEFDELAKFLQRTIPKVQERNAAAIHLKKSSKPQRNQSPETDSTQEGESSEESPTTDDEQRPARLRHCASLKVPDANLPKTPLTTTRCVSPQAAWPRQRVLASGQSFHEDVPLVKSPVSVQRVLASGQSFHEDVPLVKSPVSVHPFPTSSSFSNRAEASSPTLGFFPPNGALASKGFSCQVPPGPPHGAHQFATPHPRSPSRLHRGNAPQRRQNWSFNPQPTMLTSCRGPCPVKLC